MFLTIVKSYFKKAVLCLFVITAVSCKQDKTESIENNDSKTENIEILPFSDPENKGGWVLNEEISDEFEGTSIDTTKWFVEGQNGDYYIWKGRPPSQFAPHNVHVRDGQLVITSQWEPDYEFANEKYADGKNNDAYGELDGEPIPVTTGGIITKKRFLYGYMEVEAKVGYAAISGAFWGIGYEQELDVFELMGNPKKYGFIEGGNYFIGTAHDWSPPAVRPTAVFLHSEKLDFNTSDDFHVYAAEWGEDYISFYIDGKHIITFTQNEVGTDFIFNNPMEIWLDSEIFKRLGVPHKEELPVNFEVKYMRVWQKPSDNLLAKDRAFYGFEGPILFEENPRPLNLVPEDSNPNDYQKFWLFDEGSSKYLKITEGHYASGVEALQFFGYGKNEKLEVDKVQATTPEGALKLPAGDYNLSMKVWLDQGRITDSIHVTLMNPKTDLIFSGLKKLPRKEWVTIETKVSRTKASASNDGMIIEILKADLPETKAAKLFIDDIAIKKLK
jgi:beta-glucanase (GH16 family)